MTDYSIPLENAPQGAAAGLDTRAPLNPMGVRIAANVQPFQPINFGLDQAQAYKNAETAGEYEMAQAERMDKMKDIDTKQRDLAILKAWQGSGHGLYSEEDLTLALHELGAKLSPEAAKRLSDQLDAAKQKDATIAQTASKASIDQLQYAKDAGDYVIESMRSVQAAYDAAIKKNPNDVQGALQAFNAAKEARVQAAKAALNPVNGKPMFPPEKIAEMEKATPDTLPNLLAYTESGMKMLNSQFVNKLKQSQADKAEADAENARLKPGQTEEKIDIERSKLNIAAKRAENSLKQEVVEPLTPEGMKVAEEIISSGGNLPGGWSKAGASRGNAILNQMGRDEQGGAGSGSIVGQKAEVKSDTTSLNKMIPQLDAITAYEKTMENIGSKLKDLANKVDTTGVPVMERWLRAGKNAIEGDPDVTEFNQRMITFKTEAARITSNPNLTGVLSDSARHELAEGIPNAANAEQINRGVDTLVNEGQTRQQNLKEQIETAKSRMKSSTAFPRVTPEEQGVRDNDRKAILTQELSKAQDVLKNAKTDEDKHRAQSDVDALNRELGNKATAKKATPAGVPDGSKVIGKTPEGKEVWQSPDGKKWVD